MAAHESLDVRCASILWRVAGPVSVGKEACLRRHLGQRACGASGGMAAPQLGQDFADGAAPEFCADVEGVDCSLILPFPEAESLEGYRESRGMGTTSEWRYHARGMCFEEIGGKNSEKRICFLGCPRAF